MMQTKRITATDDLERLTREINEAVWDEANEISPYHAQALATYLARQDTVFVACHDQSSGERELLGMASSRIEMKPYDQSLWLYVDEVDVCANHRRKGVGKCIMQALLEIAEREGCEELWLGTEADNLAANALYNSLQPDDVAEVIGYTYELDD